MVNKDDRPSLLAKMAKFVRNPTKDWSELDQSEQPQDGGYDKQALKAMIERKRQNDFIRKREFEQLRKLRNKDPVAIAGMARRSFFQTSTAAELETKASTLKKIDDIEAQMSKQWWEGKQDAASTQASTLGAPMRHPNENFSTPSPQQFQSTEVALDHQDTVPVDQDSVVTQMVSGTHFVGEGRPVNASTTADGVKHYEQGDDGFTSSALFAMSPEDMSSDPELDEAAIRFANRDDVGAEQGLLQALRAGGVTTQVGRPWVAALLDLYRATNKPVSFEHVVQEFGAYFDGKTPEWISLSDAPASTDYCDTEPSVHIRSQNEPLWACPQTLNASALKNLRDLLSANPMPWHMEWSKLEVISPDALPLLEALFHSLCEEPVALRFSGASVLRGQLQDMTPTNERGVDSTWWHIRLTALRAMRLHDEFELAALHYCVTYGVAPIAWQAPRCVFEELDVNDSDACTTQTMGITANDVLPLELRGEVLGDASQLLARLDALTVDGPIIVSCTALLRVDFAAAGNILNWAAVHETQGRQVQFREVHRLVAAFFNVIGINEHARVLPRVV
ncbi:MAG: hypothetical protein RLZ68_281 [Pseudomonadota bacterium]